MISILLPVYNTPADWLLQCFESIDNQTFKDYEVIVINDCSTYFNTLDILNRYKKNPKYKIFNLAKNSGIVKALNYGIKKCQYEYIARMDSDDIMKPNRLEYQYKYMLNNPDVDVSSTDMIYIRQSGNGWFTYEKPNPHPSIVTKEYVQIHDWFLNHPAVMYKKSSVVSVGGYNEEMHGMAEDFELWVRMLKKDMILHNINEKLLIYRFSDNSLSKKFTLQNGEVIKKLQNDIFKKDEIILKNEFDIKDELIKKDETKIETKEKNIVVELNKPEKTNIEPINPEKINNIINNDKIDKLELKLDKVIEKISIFEHKFNLLSLKDEYEDELKIYKKVKNVLFMITTFNRLDFLKLTILSWYQTINKKYNWTLIVSDDNSSDGTKEYLETLKSKLKDINIIILNNENRGVHYQTNQLFKLASKMDFDIAFKSDDDLEFLNNGWDDLYIKAIQETGYEHLIFYDKGWNNNRNKIKNSIYYDNFLENCIPKECLQGAFWTFTKNIIEKVGYFDIENFGLCGLGHVDFSMRCCRLGFNNINNPYDIINSNNYIQLIKENYISHNNNNKNLWNTKEQILYKQELISQNRTFIPYNDIKIKMNGDKVEEEYINTYFDNIYCLNLDRRLDKWEKVKKRFDELNIKVERFSAVDGNNIFQDELKNYKKINKYELGCILSHYEIIKDAKQKGYKKILILEDDVLFCDNFHIEFKNFINNIPDWKLLYFGASQYFWNVDFLNNYYLPNKTCGTFAYAINESIYDIILNTKLIKDIPIDSSLYIIQDLFYTKCFVSYPNLIIADVSDSDIRNSRDRNIHNEKMRWNIKNYK